MRDPRLRNSDILRLTLNTDEVEALEHSSNTGAPAACKRVKHDPAGRSDEPDKPTHKFHWFVRGMSRAFAIGQPRIAFTP
jgi:hypothetical protein